MDPVALLEERFRSLVACADDTIVMTDLEGTIVFINDAGRRLVGVPEAEDLTGLNVFDLLAEDSRADAADALRRVRTDGVAHRSEHFVQRRDGGRVPIEVSASVMRDATGQPVGYMSIIRDITAHRRQQEKTAALLAVSRAISGQLQLWEILERVQRHTCEALGCDAVATFCWDEERAAYRLAGHSGKRLSAAFHDPSLEFPRGIPFVDRLTTVRTIAIGDVEQQDWIPIDLLRSLSIEALISTQLVVQGKAVGALVALHLRRGMVFDADQIELFEGISQQLAVSMEAAELYRKRHEEAEAASALARELDIANRTKSDFVAAIAHELRSPLSVITGYSTLLLDGAFGGLGTEQTEVMQRIDRTTATLAELVNTLLDFSRLESGQLRIEARDVEIAALLEAVEEETRDLRAGKPEVAFRFGVAGDLAPVHTDPLKLKVVVKNLIGNALKFTDQGEVGLRARAVEGGVEIEVADTGMGIPADSLESIFDAFRQAAGGRKVHGGFGLGLYIVRRLLDLLGGKIRVESEQGRGTTFFVFLPSR